MLKLFQNNKFLVFLFFMSVFGIIQLGVLFFPVVIDGVMCMTISSPIEYTGTAIHMCDDFGNYFVTQITIRFFN